MGSLLDRERIEDLLPLRPIEFQILLILADGERHGYGIMQESEARSEGKLVLEAGTLYRALKRLLEAGMISESKSKGGDSRQRRYKVTPFGKKVAAAEARRMAELVSSAKDARLLRWETS